MKLSHHVTIETNSGRQYSENLAADFLAEIAAFRDQDYREIRVGVPLERALQLCTTRSGDWVSAATGIPGAPDGRLFYSVLALLGPCGLNDIVIFERITLVIVPLSARGSLELFVLPEE